MIAVAYTLLGYATAVVAVVLYLGFKYICNRRPKR